ncbi:quinoprotein dehydrogenase-associated putative ABC transporter substrate-binding protein [Sphingomonas sp. MAH-20]|uniref:Quinoprotein dehydrogenase-associated putative ABC transporter substrate-binding protein n=1 Tax=Sphingomonas horti TaxID=2682842 RepID=A0A6I4J3S5_9SPHN|nr:MULTISPECIES: quinoprotein dehydrogenase-associated putative ABC transporter substrate-binding protein [Sphingomonas]MBA2918871.1 quinoprotein dehydrogenase-associated putative ABC transporter substrate-binding protein [Sphingomonas sp. CGMCC 1.13658]MVO78904.1 quinoprotein dehydrogenase-associated putative ABC transporter substrate-binding protein [Sphingomonas horti]
MGRRGLALMLALAAAPAGAAELRVCADPNNMPFSNAKGEGFENKLVERIAADWGRTVQYTWWAQRRGNVRNTLKAGECDLIPGIGSAVEMVGTTRPYYRARYMFVTRADRSLDIAGFDDPRLRTLKIGVQMVGDDGSNTPPAHALAKRGIVDNVRGYLIYGDYAEHDPQAAIVRAVAAGEVDVALVWGPTAQWYAKSSAVPLKLTPTPWLDGPQLPMQFDVSMGVRREDDKLRAELNAWLTAHRDEVEALLARYR